jgi:chemotaxis protein histidine kinase CheA
VGGEDKILNLVWEPIYDSNLNVEKILVCIRDVTDLRKLKVQLAQQETRVSRTSQVLLAMSQSPTMDVEVFLARTLREMDQAKNERIKETALVEMQRSLHTTKGGARVLGLVQLADLVHDAEDAIASANGLFDERLQEVTELVSSYHAIAAQYSAGIRQSGPWTLFARVGMMVRDIEDMALTGGATLGSIVCHDSVIHFDDSEAELIETLMIHGISNSVDHGFLRPKARGERIKPIELAIWAERGAEGTTVRLDDNGAGIDLDGLRNRAFKEAPELTDQPIELLFRDGFSTAEIGGKLSGRGIGLGAVRGQARKVGGDLLVSQIPGGGTRLLLKLPAKKRQAA